MDKELQEYYENYFTLFTQPGWKQLMEDLEDVSESIDLLSIKDAKELHVTQGQQQVFNRILRWKDSITNSYDLTVNEELYEREDLH